MISLITTQQGIIIIIPILYVAKLRLEEVIWLAKLTQVVCGKAGIWTKSPWLQSLTSF